MDMINPVIVALLMVVFGYLVIYEMKYGFARYWVVMTVIFYIAEFAKIIDMDCRLIPVACRHTWIFPTWVYLVWLVLGVIIIVAIKMSERRIENNQHVAEGWKSRG